MRRVRPDMAGSLRYRGRRVSARSTIDRGLADLRSGAVMCSPRVRRRGGGGKPATETQPGLLEAMNDLVQSAIRGDPEAALLWVTRRASRSPTTRWQL